MSTGRVFLHTRVVRFQWQWPVFGRNRRSPSLAEFLRKPSVRWIPHLDRGGIACFRGTRALLFRAFAFMMLQQLCGRWDIRGRVRIC